MRELLKKLQRNLKKSAIFIVIFTIFVGTSGFAEPCTDCDKLRIDLAKEVKSISTYQTLKQKNEEYLAKPGINDSSSIKCKGNILLINIKIETGENNKQALDDQIKKLNGCTSCPIPKSA